ncbi:Hypothetical protein, putative [Bodo saltans]|uniref:ZP domain-containing protein n=1 Tax=Bodo saltans TaxID=75058 RepID=A0A0S4JJQ1_BODSA|nr:Hypothetical protein, putative [Bodo saltans]|eukprot:CUG89225.1 Hypothetical protein, putative [Bodo saltans]
MMFRFVVRQTTLPSSTLFIFCVLQLCAKDHVTSCACVKPPFPVVRCSFFVCSSCACVKPPFPVVRCSFFVCSSCAQKITSHFTNRRAKSCSNAFKAMC